MDQITPPGISLPTRIEIDRPVQGDLLRARAPISGSGWVLCAADVRSIDVFLGNDLLCHARMGIPRAEVAQTHWFYPGADHAGFAFAAELPPELNASHSTLRVVVTTPDNAFERRVELEVAAPTEAPAPQPAAVPAPNMVAPSAAPPAMLLRIEEARVTDEGVLRVRGWAVSFSPIEHVEISLGGRVLGHAQMKIARNDVADALPDYPGSDFSGFLFQQALDETVPAGDLRVHALAQGGISREVTIPVARPAALPSKAASETSGEVHFHCDAVQLSEDGHLALVGWATCASGVRQIEVELDGEPVGSAELGGSRPDVGNNYPDIASARNAGFRMRAALGRDCPGEHLVRFTIRGFGTEERRVVQAVQAHPVVTARGEAANAPPIRCFLETPSVADGHAKEVIRGFLSVNGWAFSRAGIASIEVFVDGHSQGLAHHGIRREDLQAAFATEDALLAGYAMLVPPQVMKPGRHDVRVVYRDKEGAVGEHAFSVEAEAAAEGPGPWQLRRKLRDAEVDLQLRIVDASGARPQFAILLNLPANSPEAIAAAAETAGSLRDQAYANWSLRVVAPNRDQAADLHRAIASVPGFPVDRIDVSPSPDEAKPDDLVCPLREGDILGEDALLELAVARAINPAADFLYSDERRLDPADRQIKAFFKPDWSPDLLLSTNYIGRLWAASANLLQAADVDFHGMLGSGEYDAILRATERAKHIVHIPKVLCTRGRPAIDSPVQERRAIGAAMRRKGTLSDISAGCTPGTYRVRSKTIDWGGPESPLVSIVIPTIATRGLIKTTIDSIRLRTAYRQFEIVCLDNIVARDDPEKLRWKQWIAENSDTVVETKGRFNWSRFNNRAVRRARGSVLLFLNDDVEVLAPDWLEVMLEQALRPEIGVVGPQLLYPDGRVQHAGVFLGRNVGRHAFRFYPRDTPGPFGLALTQRNVISVTGACMMMRREVFEALGGFNEAHAVINNDLDFCLRANREGLRVLYTPHATLIHHEMVSRSSLSDVYDSAEFDSAWKTLFLRGDPYFNPNLTTEFDDYLPEAEPVQAVHVGHPFIRRERVRRILAVKVDHIGDFISAFPAFRRIKQRFPEAELCVLAARASLSIAALEPAIDRVIEFNFYHAKSQRGQRRSAARELRDLEALLTPERFDIAIDLRRQPDTRHLLQHTGARWLAGFDENYTHTWLDITVEWEGDLARTHKRSHVVDSLIQLVDAVTEACDADRDVVHGAPGRDACREQIARLPAVADIAEAMFSRRLVCVHTGAGSENKQWPAASFAGLIDLLVDEDAVNVVLIGGPDEAAIAGETLREVRARDRVFSLVGKTSLRDLPRVLKACDLYIGNDSGPKHIAASLGVPTVGIHAGSVDTREWGPMGPLAFAIRRDVTCSPCYLARVSDCHRGLACLNGIRVGDVYRECRRMFALAGKIEPKDKGAGAPRAASRNFLSGGHDDISHSIFHPEELGPAGVREGTAQARHHV